MLITNKTKKQQAKQQQQQTKKGVEWALGWARKKKGTKTPVKRGEIILCKYYC